MKETGSEWMERLFDSQDDEFFIATVTLVEIVSALTRRSLGGTLSPEISTAARALFRADLLTDYQTVELTVTLIEEAMRLAELHGLRGYDAVQLAAALAINRTYSERGAVPITFISADGRLNQAALLEGIRVDNPNDHP